ncbi:unnamed protein product [Caenorhabditis angaria]|uniref:Mitochondrial inner membrane protein Mpv17 n=1 Tax=Caenorhabditis angaria TaxID=860376 RepID=A0A9P1J324_9PELO|nr:unnamed protein product [Caenorhabditis angaria]
MILKLLKNRLKTNPLTTQMMIAGTISGSGDCVAQYWTGNKTWDKVRTARFAFLASCFMVPTVNVWYKLLDKLQGSTKLGLVVKRVMIDQLCFSPVFNAAMLFNLRFLQFQSAEKSIEMLKEDWFNIWTSSLKVWPTVALINFYFMPIQYRITINQIVSFFWNSYLSYSTQKPIDHIEQFY